MPKPSAQQWANRGLNAGFSYEETKKKIQEEGLFNTGVDQEIKGMYGIAELSTSERIAEEKYKTEQAEAQKVKDNKFENTENILGIVNQLDSKILAKKGFEGSIGAKTINPFKREIFKTTTPEGEEVVKFRGGTEEANFENLRQSLISKINVDARDKLKGQGEITGEENKMLAKAETLLANPDITEEEFKKHLYAFRDELNLVVKNASEEVGQESKQVGFTNMEEAKQNLSEKVQYAMDNPDDPDSTDFLEAFKNDQIDVRTGKLKEEFREKSEAELLVEEKLKASGLYDPVVTEEQPTAGGEGEQEKKGFGEAFGELRGATKELEGVTEQQEALGGSIEERNQKAKDLSLVGNYERALEAKDDPQAKAFLDKLTDEDKAKITELQKLTPEEREAQRQEILTGVKGTQEKLGKFGEQIDSATSKGEEAIKSNRGLETFGDVAEAGKGILEAGGEGISTVGESFSRAMNDNQDPASTGIQVVGALGKFLGESAGALTIGAAKVALPQGAEEVIGEGAAKAVNAILETPAGQKGLELAQAGGEDWKEFKKEHPTAAANLEGVVGIIEGVSTIGGAGVAKSVTKKGLKTAGGVAKNVGGKVAKGAKEGFEKQAVKQGVKKAEKEAVKNAGKVGELEDIIMPKMTSKELNKASLEGRVTRGAESKLTGKAKDFVDASETIKKDADLIRNKIKGFDKLDDQELSSKVDLEGNKIFNKIKPEMEKVELKADSINKKVKVWDKIKKQQAGDPDFEAFGGKKLQSNFENVLNEIKKGSQGTGGKFRKKNLNDLWELRQKYDKLVPDRIKNADSLSDSRAQYQKDVWLENRRILNDIITDTSNEMGSSTAKAFEEMSAFKRIRQNIAGKTKLEKEEIGLTGKAKKKLIGTGTTVGLTAAGTAVGLKGLQ